MSDFVILLLILFLVICLILTLVGFVFYTGLFSEVVIRTGSPPVKNITIAYKFRKGSYKASGAAFTESCSIGPKLWSVGVFYDDPNQTQADQCRYVVGSILCENEEKPDEELQRLYEKFGYKVISFPEVTCAVTSSFPNRCTLSPVCGAYRVYPDLQQYIKRWGLEAINLPPSTHRPLATRPFVFLRDCGSGNLVKDQFASPFD
ncbi:testis-expressed sequence 264 protein-like [Labeo rohita]|uniref:Testis-expressed sequence 264 protein-like n=1 Tax=Labeo rohita TaxID=84645 RepID=A0A498L647_LABRO|nr:testis-expressed sequence 264 protein-like [Labeo rohita]